MNRAVAVVEGQSEQTFVRDVLADWLAARGVYLTARLVGRPGHKGGVGPYLRARRDILALLRQEADTVVTTMFDFFGMPLEWPGRRQAAKAAHARKSALVEQALLDDITDAMGRGFDQKRFIPYVQMYEFEALLYTRPEDLAAAVGEPTLARKLRAIRDRFGCPEEINDGRETAPSKRIQELSERAASLTASRSSGDRPFKADPRTLSGL